MSEIEELYEFFYLTPVGLAKIKADGVIEQINPFMCNLLLSIDPQFAENNDLFDTLGKFDPEFVGACQKLSASAGKTLDNYMIDIHTNGIKKIRIKCARIFGDKYVFVIENMTDYVTMEESKQQAEHELDQQKERLAKLGSVIRMVVHDLRNPISNIKTLADMVEIVSLEEARTLMTENIGTVLNEINMIMNDLLDYTRAEIPQFEAIDFDNFAANLRMKFELMSRESGVTIIFTHDGNFIFYGDQGKLMRVFSNITANAVKALRSAAIPQPEIKVAIEVSDPILVITIGDNGGGIPAELIDTLFEPFSIKSHYAGNGIGLPIVKNIIDMHKGTIEIHSDTRGTVFEIKIPLDPRAI